MTVYQESGGADPLIAPQLLLFAVPNDTTDMFGATNPISSVTYTNPFPGGTMTTGSSGAITPGQFGIKPLVSGDFFYGSMMGANSLDIYSFLALSGPGVDNSNNISNYTMADANLGVSADNWGIYGVALSGQTLDANGVVDSLLSTVLPTGTFAAAYGRDGTGVDFKVYVNAFTEADAFTPGVTPVPEPSVLSLMSLGAGALALFSAARRRRESI